MERPTLDTVLQRAVRLRCPRCAGGKLFAGPFRMYTECPNCKLKYERAPGYFLGSTYINYGVSGFLITVSYVVLHFGVGYSNRTLALPLTAFAICFPMFFFRYARSLWLGLDCYIDPVPTETDHD